MQSIPSLLPSTIRAAAFSRVFSALRTRKGSLPLCGVLAFVLGGAWVGVHAQTAHFFEAQSVIANAANNGLNDPEGVAVDGSGNLYIADFENSRVLKETLSAGGYTQSVLANNAANGLTSAFGVAVDGNGNVYITDGYSDRVLKETLSAGGYIQSVVANAANNGLQHPDAVAVDGNGNVYITDSSLTDASNSQVLKETLSLVPTPRALS
jgi:sugar lactone lactonase YvrE